MSELHIGNSDFDPAHPVVRSQLLSLLGLSANSNMKRMQVGGGLNEGMWALRDGAEDLILKLVCSSRHESEKLVQLSLKHRSMAADCLLSFPLQIVHLLGANGVRRYDLIVMRRARGVSLSMFVGERWQTGQCTDALRVIEKLGTCLNDFHSRYGDSQHGDFHTSNIFYDEVTDKFTFIDVADIGDPHRTKDKEYLLQALKMVSFTLGSDFLTKASHAFESGYSRF